MWALAAHAAPEDALAPDVRALWLDGKLLEARGDPSEAATRFHAVWERSPGFTQAVIEWGASLEIAGDGEGALKAYGEAPYDADVVEARAQLLERLGRNEEALAAYRLLQELRSEDPQRFILAEARVSAAIDPIAAVTAYRAWFAYPGAQWGPEGLATLDAIFEALRAGPPDAQNRIAPLYDDVKEALPAAETDPGFLALRERIDVEDLAKRLAGASPDPLSGAQSEALDRARAAFAAGDATAALAGLHALEAQAPRNPAVQDALGEVLASQGSVGDAEVAYRRASAFGPLEASYEAHLGELLARAYGGRRDVDAADALRIALILDPTNADLLARKADLDARTRNPQQLNASIAGWRHYLQEAPDGPRAAEARAIVAGADRAAPALPDIPSGPGRPDTVPIDVWDATWMAQAWALHGNDAEAMAALDRALASDPTYAPALTAKGRRVLAAPNPSDADRTDATALFQRSLASDPNQPDVILDLADLALAGGDAAGARQLRERAAELGSADARYLIARDDYDAGHLLDARTAIEAWFAGPTGDHLVEARALRAAIDDDLRARIAAGGAIALAALGIPLFAWRRRRAGVGLDAFLAASPHSFRDLARVASTIRHDVIKHHTAALDAVADALDAGPAPDGTPAASEDAGRWIADRLYGDEGAIAKFRAHVREIDALARLQGVPLNLRHRDPVFGPLIGAFDRLEGLKSQLTGGHGRRLASDLRAISYAINTEGSQALARLVRRLCLLPIDRAALEAAWTAASGEPAFRGKTLPAFTVALDGEPPIVRMFRKDLDDILLNVVRNALEASIAAGTGRVGVRVASDEDPVTGIERVALRVRDDAPKRVTTAVIRGRYIERGLGLTVDLISRNAGSIKVEDEPEWSKAVVVRFPRVEQSEEP